MFGGWCGWPANVVQRISSGRTCGSTGVSGTPCRSTPCRMDKPYPCGLPTPTATVSCTPTSCGSSCPRFISSCRKRTCWNVRTFILSDEPAAEHIANYRRARQTLRELAPWMKVMDALSDVEYGRQALTDMPIPMVSAAQAYIDEKIPHWVYYCCAPRGPYLNRFLDTPLAKIRMSGWCSTACGPRGSCTGDTIAGRSSNRMP